MNLLPLGYIYIYILHIFIYTYNNDYMLYIYIHTHTFVCTSSKGETWVCFSGTSFVTIPVTFPWFEGPWQGGKWLDLWPTFHKIWRVVSQFSPLVQDFFNAFFSTHEFILLNFFHCNLILSSIKNVQKPSNTWVCLELLTSGKVPLCVWRYSTNNWAMNNTRVV